MAGEAKDREKKRKKKKRKKKKRKEKAFHRRDAASAEETEEDLAKGL